MISNRIIRLIQGTQKEFASGFKEYMSTYLDSSIVDKFVFTQDMLYQIYDKRSQKSINLDQKLVFQPDTFIIKTNYPTLTKGKVVKFLHNSLIYILIVQKSSTDPSKLAKCLSVRLFEEDFNEPFPTIFYVRSDLTGMYASDQKIYYPLTILKREGSKVALLYPNLKMYSYLVLYLPYQEELMDLLPTDIVKSLIQNIPDKKLIELYHSGIHNWLDRDVMATSINWSYDTFLYALLYDPELAKIMVKTNPTRVNDLIAGKVSYQKKIMVIDGTKFYFDKDDIIRLAKTIGL